MNIQAVHNKEGVLQMSKHTSGVLCQKLLNFSETQTKHVELLSKEEWGVGTVNVSVIGGRCFHSHALRMFVSSDILDCNISYSVNIQLPELLSGKQNTHVSGIHPNPVPACVFPVKSEQRADNSDSLRWRCYGGHVILFTDIYFLFIFVFCTFFLLSRQPK